MTRVLMSPGARTTNPFVEMLVTHLDQDITVLPFSWARALRGRWDVLHVHWPDALVRGRGPLGRIRTMLFRLLIRLDARRGRRHLWTVHNLKPHDGASSSASALTEWEQSCAAFVFLSQLGIEPSMASRASVIPHGDYAPVVPATRNRPVPVPGRLLALGLIRPYKRLESLIEALGDTDDSLSLRIVGKPLSRHYAEELEKSSSGDRRVFLRFGDISDSELVAELDEAEFAVLPYRNPYNSGAALLALTAARPLIVSDSPTMRALRDEAGHEWVHCVVGEWTPAALELAIADLRGRPRQGAPALRGREWADLGAQYAMLYRALAAQS